MKDWFNLLTARPSFIAGFASVMDLGATLTEFNTSLSERQADYIALQADVEAVANDMWQVIHEFDAQRPS